MATSSYRRHAWRLLVVPAVVGYVLMQGSSGTVWLWAAAVIALVVVAMRWPLAAAIGQAAALTVAFHYFPDVETVAKVASAVAVVELTVRRFGRQTIVGAGTLAAAYIAHDAGELPGTALEAAYHILVVAGGPVLIGAYLRSMQRNARQAQERALDAERRRELAVQTARLAERTAIARELHDVVAHHVASMTLRIEVARYVALDADPRLREVFDDVHATGTAAMADLRQLVATLRDPDAQASYPDALTTALDAIVGRTEQAGLSVDAAIDPSVEQLDTVRGLAVLRLVQEGLTNVVKHARPGARATLRVESVDDAVQVELTNDGVGSGTPGEGYGLVGMRERVELAGGRLDAGPTSSGWRLAATLPAIDIARVPEAVT